MPPTKRPSLQRPYGNVSYKPLFVIATEGCVTEPDYFNLLKALCSDCAIVILSQRHKSAPHYILKMMKDYISRNPLKKGSEAWIVIDADQWTEAHRQELVNWRKKNSNYRLAISNPCFECWLLLHFEDSSSSQNATQCRKNLSKHLPNYDKNLRKHRGKINLQSIHEAISRAKALDSSTGDSENPMPPLGTSRVYQLVERITATIP